MLHQDHPPTEPQTPCCGGAHGHEGPVQPPLAAKYFCPMCAGVESDRPGTCPKCGMALERNHAWKAATVYTCPMHPEIEQDHPGSCPKCGMALEPKSGAAPEDDEHGELRDMTRRLWIGGALALPVFLLAMTHLFPAAPAWVDGDVSRWLQLALATPVVLWAGWPFFVRGWQSVVNRHLNMFTLIAIGVGVAWLFSAIVMLAPGLFPASFQHHGRIGVYFEAAAVVTVLVLVGQVLGAARPQPHRAGDSRAARSRAAGRADRLPRRGTRGAAR